MNVCVWRWVGMQRTPTRSWPAADKNCRGPGCVREGAAVAEPTAGRTIADTARRDVARGVRRLPQVW
jgi:hypothetical protein